VTLSLPVHGHIRLKQAHDTCLILLMAVDPFVAAWAAEGIDRMASGPPEGTGRHRAPRCRQSAHRGGGRAMGHGTPPPATRYGVRAPCQRHRTSPRDFQVSSRRRVGCRCPAREREEGVRRRPMVPARFGRCVAFSKQGEFYRCMPNRIHGASRPSSPQPSSGWLPRCLLQPRTR